MSGLHHGVVFRITVRQTRRGRDCVWVYPPQEEAIAEAGLQEVNKYVSRRHNTVTQFIATRPIMDLCLAEERCLGSRVEKKGW